MEPDETIFHIKFHEQFICELLLQTNDFNTWINYKKGCPNSYSHNSHQIMLYKSYYRPYYIFANIFNDSTYVWCIIVHMWFELKYQILHANAKYAQ